MKKILSWFGWPFKFEGPESYVIPTKPYSVPKSFRDNNYVVKLHCGEVFTVCAQMFEVDHEHGEVWFWMVNGDGTRKSGVAYFRLVDVRCVIDETVIPEEQAS